MYEFNRRGMMDRLTTVCVLNDQIKEDPILMEAMKMVFDWANQMGLDGVKCCNLTFEKEKSIFGGYINVKCEKHDKYPIS